MRIPLFYLRDKQAFTKKEGVLSLAGKPLDIAKELKKEGVVLIHFVDLDALSGLSKNFDVYGSLTFFINVEVECAPRPELITRLLSFKCRVVLPPDAPVSDYREKKLLVAKVPKSYAGEAGGFHDVILEDADKDAADKFGKLGKRIIIYEKDREKVKGPWGVISSS